MVRTWRFHFGGPGSIPGLGSRIPQDVGRGRKKKKTYSKYYSEIKNFLPEIGNETKMLGLITSIQYCTGHPNRCNKLLELEEARKEPPLEPSKGAQPC